MIDSVQRKSRLSLTIQRWPRLAVRMRLGRTVASDVGLPLDFPLYHSRPRAALARMAEKTMMKRSNSARAASFAIVIAAASTEALSRTAAAQSSGGPYRIDASVIASGGGHSASEGFQVDGTVGQSVATMISGGAYSVQAGFRHAPVETTDLIFADGFEN